MRLLRDINPARAERIACRAIEIGALNYRASPQFLPTTSTATPVRQPQAP
jgi:hypothetical protein